MPCSDLGGFWLSQTEVIRVGPNLTGDIMRGGNFNTDTPEGRSCKDTEKSSRHLQVKERELLEELNPADALILDF